MIILDASALVKLVTNEGGHQHAKEVFEKELASGGRIATVNLAITESINALWKYHALKKKLTVSEYDSAVDDAIKIFNRLEKIDDKEIAKSASVIAAQLKVPVYDAFYLSASIFTMAPLFTFDVNLRNKAELLGIATIS